MASITFQKKTYYLGIYSDKEEAIRVRKQAEETVHREAAHFYEIWKKRADAEPEWAEKHPISFHVVKTGRGDLKMEILPKMDD